VGSSASTTAPLFTDMPPPGPADWGSDPLRCRGCGGVAPPPLRPPVVSVRPSQPSCNPEATLPATERYNLSKAAGDGIDAGEGCPSRDRPAGPGAGWVDDHPRSTALAGRRTRPLHRSRRRASHRGREGRPADRRGGQELHRSVAGDRPGASARTVRPVPRLAQAHGPRALAVSGVDRPTFGQLFDTPIGRMLLDDERLQLLVFDPRQGEMVEWIPTR